MPTYEELLAAGAQPAGPEKGGLTYEQLTAAGAKPAEATASETPGLFDRLGVGLSRIGNTVSKGAAILFGDTPLTAALAAPEGHALEAAGSAFKRRLGDITEPAKRREALRGIDDVATLGYGQKLAARIGNALGDTPGTALGSETFGAGAGGPPVANTQVADRAAAPGYRQAGNLVGTALPGASGAAAKGGARLIGAATGGLKATTLPGAALLGGLRGVAGYEATAPALAGLSADAEGHRLEAARDAAADPAGLFLAGTGGALSGTAENLVETAPERTAKRQAKDITTGEQNAKAKVTRQVQERAGEGGKDLAETLARDPELEKLVAVKAGSSPGIVAKAVRAKTEELGGQLDDIYDKMDAAGRVVTPTDIAVNFDKALAEKLKAGDLEAVNALRKVRAQFLDEYGNFGKLSAETMRGLKRTAGRAAFAGDPAASPAVRAQVQRDVWGVFSDAIERQAAGAKDVDIGKLRQLNKDVSRLIPAQAALDERAAMQGAGRASLAHHIGSHALPVVAAILGGEAGGALGGHGLVGAAAGLVAPTAIRLGRQAVRRADYGLSKTFGGQFPDLAPAVGARTGSLEYAARVGDLMRSGMSLEQASKAAEGE